MSEKQIIFYDKKTCGTCKKAKIYLDEGRYDYQVIDINKTPPPRDLLEKYVDESDIKKFLNSRSKIYREKEFSKQLPKKTEAIDLMLEHPDLIKRPVIIQGDTVLFGFEANDVDDLKR